MLHIVSFREWRMQRKICTIAKNICDPQWRASTTMCLCMSLASVHCIHIDKLMGTEQLVQARVGFDTKGHLQGVGKADYGRLYRGCKLREWVHDSWRWHVRYSCAAPKCIHRLARPPWFGTAKCMRVPAQYRGPWFSNEAHSYASELSYLESREKSCMHGDTQLYVCMDRCGFRHMHEAWRATHTSKFLARKKKKLESSETFSKTDR